MHNPYLLILLLCGLQLFASCTLLDREEPLPAWLVIDSFQLKDNPNVTEGSLRHDITDAWVFIDEELVGVYELPAEIAILNEGNRRLLIGPGIKVSTVSTLRDNYLFYTAHEQNITLVPGEKVTVTPQVTYRDEDNTYKYVIVEEFEDSFLDLEPGANTDALIKRTTDPSLVYEGSGSGIIQIYDTTKAAWIRTSEDFVLPQQGKVVYLELDYYTQYDLVIGVTINNIGIADQNISYLTLKADQSGEVVWRKAYVALTSALAQGRIMESASVYFLPAIQNTGPANGIILLDNIKILYQQ